MFALGQFDGDNAQRPNVRFQTGVLLEDFGRHVRRRAADQRAIGRGGVELFGETEIAEFDEPLLGDEQVVRLDVLRFTAIAIPTRWMIFLLCRYTRPYRQHAMISRISSSVSRFPFRM